MEEILKESNEEIQLPPDNASVRFKVEKTNKQYIGDYIESEKMFYVTPSVFFYAHEVSKWELLNEF